MCSVSFWSWEWILAQFLVNNGMFKIHRSYISRIEEMTRVNILHKCTLGKQGISITDWKPTDTFNWAGTINEWPTQELSCAPESGLQLHTVRTSTFTEAVQLEVARGIHLQYSDVGLCHYRTTGHGWSCLYYGSKHTASKALLSRIITILTRILISKRRFVLMYISIYALQFISADCDLRHH